MSTIRTEALDKIVSELERFEIDLNQYWNDLEPQAAHDVLLSGKIDALAHFCQTLGWSELCEQLNELLPPNVPLQNLWNGFRDMYCLKFGD